MPPFPTGVAKVATSGMVELGQLPNPQPNCLAGPEADKKLLMARAGDFH